MNKIIVSLISIIVFQSQAGVSTSGGGYAVVCRNSKQKIVSAELLDIVEGSQRYGFYMQKTSGSLLKDYEYSVNNTYQLQMSMPCNFPGCMSPEEGLNRFMKIVDWVEDKSQLPIIFDLGDVTAVTQNLKTGCDIEQIAYFEDNTDHVQISKEAWNSLDSLSQAALVQHELMYTQARAYFLLPESSSERSRLNVSIIFSKGLEEVHQGIPSTSKIETIFHDINGPLTNKFDSTSYFKFLIKDSENYTEKVFRTQFTHLGGRPVLTKTFIDLPAGVDFLQTYPIQGQQFKGWYVIVLPAQTSSNLTGVTLRVMNEKGYAVMDLQ